MLRCKVHNIITGGRYELQARDQSAIDLRLALKADGPLGYGRPAWTETIPAWTDTTAGPPVEHPAQVINHPAEHVLEVTNIDAELAAAEAERTARAQAVAYLRGLDFDAASLAQTRRACGALWTLLRAMHRDGR